MTGRWSSLTSASGQFTCAQKEKARPARPVTRGTSASGHASRRTESSRVMIGHGARLVMCDRTRPVVEGAYWTLIGRWHCRVRSLPGARPVIALRARGVARPACPVSLTSASGHSLQRVRSARPARPVVASQLAVARPARLVSLTSASGQRDFGWLKFLTAIFEGVCYK
jgi:hypothetical protein